MCKWFPRILCASVNQLSTFFTQKWHAPSLYRVQQIDNRNCASTSKISTIWNQFWCYLLSCAHFSSLTIVNVKRVCPFSRLINNTMLERKHAWSYSWRERDSALYHWCKQSWVLFLLNNSSFLISFLVTPLLTRITFSALNVASFGGVFDTNIFLNILKASSILPQDTYIWIAEL